MWWRRLAAGCLGLGLALGLVGQTLRGTAAQAAGPVLTLVTTDGGLWAVPSGGSPSQLRPNVAKGAQVSGLAWHPTRPEVLLVRRSMLPEHEINPEVPPGPPEPFDTL